MDVALIICNIAVALAAAASLLLSIITYRNSGRKLELTHAERESVMRWYSETMDCLMLLKSRISSGDPFDKTACLAKLSSLIEQGRLFFPNNLDGTGKGKPSAYRGTRDIALDMLVYYYDICMMPDARFRISHLETLERKFTSRVFDVVNPREYNSQTAKTTFVKPVPDERAILKEFLASDPSKNDFWNGHD